MLKQIKTIVTKWLKYKGFPAINWYGRKPFFAYKVQYKMAVFPGAPLAAMRYIVLGIHL
jgi:hypothetical protein